VTGLGVLSLRRALVHLLYASRLPTARASARNPLVEAHRFASSAKPRRVGARDPEEVHGLEGEDQLALRRLLSLWSDTGATKRTTRR
jgi:hypothetical protein